jgi:hypothetical protein
MNLSVISCSSFLLCAFEREQEKNRGKKSILWTCNQPQDAKKLFRGFSSVQDTDRQILEAAARNCSETSVLGIVRRNTVALIMQSCCFNVPRSGKMTIAIKEVRRADSCVKGHFIFAQ